MRKRWHFPWISQTLIELEAEAANESLERKLYEQRQREWSVKRGRRKDSKRGVVQVEGSKPYPGSNVTFHGFFISKEVPTSQAGFQD